MAGPYRRTKVHKCHKEISRSCRLRRKTKDLDQIENDLKPENMARLLKEVVDEDLPGGGNFLCVECSRHFVNQETLDHHKTTKPHKRRLKNLAEGAYTLEEANAAGGSGSNDFYAKRLAKLEGKKHESSIAYKKIDASSGASKESQEAQESLMSYE